MGHREGFTLIEMIVALGIIAVSLIMIISIIPTGVLSLKKAEDIQSASAYGMSLIEETRKSRPAYTAYPVTDLTAEKVFNNTRFLFQRDIYAIDSQNPHNFYDIVVTITWSRQPQPLRLSTRILYQE
jgi:prepilin-type N-terminal cleavage/methylation domain-containing protein